MPENKDLLDAPKRLRRTLEKLAREGDLAVYAFPALLERYCDRQTMAMARLGDTAPRIASWVVLTGKSVHFVRAGMFWDSVQSIPLEKVTALEYVDEYHTNTIKIRVGDLSENIIFYEDVDGIKFYQHLRRKICELGRDGS